MKENGIFVDFDVAERYIDRAIFSLLAMAFVIDLIKSMKGDELCG